MTQLPWTTWRLPLGAALLLGAALCAGGALVPGKAAAMRIKLEGDQLILSGEVTGDEFDRVRAALDAAKTTRTVILRNSPGGDAVTGYRVGDLMRARRLRTAVSGYCYSSCSRMFLGGEVREFSDDYPLGYTEVGFHGHYDRNGQLLRESIDALGLEDWIVRHSDGKADAALVRRWTHIPYARGMAHFYHPILTQARGAAAFLCQGTERRSVFGCERIERSALDLGVITDTSRISSNDQAELRRTVPAELVPSGAELTELAHVPLTTEAGFDNYRRFLLSPEPRVFAVSADHLHWAWNSGNSDAWVRAVSRCQQRSTERCAPYAVDQSVVWQGGDQ